MTTLYEACLSAGLELDNHESDLYIRDTPEAQRLLLVYKAKAKPFRDAIDGERWIEVPFAYDPFWKR